MSAFSLKLVLISIYLVSPFLYSAKPEPTPAQTWLESSEQEEDSALQKKKTEAYSLVVKSLWQKYGLENEPVIIAMYELLKPIVDNRERGECLGGQKRLDQFAILLDKLLSTHVEDPLGSKQRQERLANILQQAQSSVSDFNQAFSEEEFDLSPLIDRIELLKSDLYRAHGCNFTLGVMFNAGPGAGCGVQKNALGEYNWAFMLQAVFAVGCCQFAVTSVESQKKTLDFCVRGDVCTDFHGAMGLGATCFRNNELRMWELIVSPISGLKGIMAWFFPLSPKILSTTAFLKNLGLTEETCNKDIGDHYTNRINGATNMEELQIILGEIQNEISTR